MVRFICLLLTLLSSTVLPLFGTPDTEWLLHKTEDGAHPDNNEQQMVWLMNRARTNPIEEGKWFAGETLPLPTNVSLSISGVPVNTNQLKVEFNEIPPKQPAAFNRYLYEGSKLHSEHMISIDTQTHDGQIGRIPEDFVRNGGSLSVFWRAQDGVHGHAALNVDWGFGGFGDEFGMQPGRGHRASIHGLGFGPSNVGIAMVPDNDSQTTAGPLDTSIAYYNSGTFPTNNYNRHVVGTIWTDTNGNSQYDPGEGHGGVTVMPDIGQFWTTTSDSGGFAFPATEEGTYTITISGGAITEPQQRIVQVSNLSVLMIWNEADKWPDPPVAEAPLLQVARNGTIEFSFPIKSGQSYQLRNTTGFSTFQNDNRPFSMNGDIWSFAVSQGDIDAGTFFDILVTVD